MAWNSRDSPASRLPECHTKGTTTPSLPGNSSRHPRLCLVSLPTHRASVTLPLVIPEHKHQFPTCILFGQSLAKSSSKCGVTGLCHFCLYFYPEEFSSKCLCLFPTITVTAQPSPLPLCCQSSPEERMPLTHHSVLFSLLIHPNFPHALKPVRLLYLLFYIF